MCLTSRICERAGCWRNRVFCGHFKTSARGSWLRQKSCQEIFSHFFLLLWYFFIFFLRSGFRLGLFEADSLRKTSKGFTRRLHARLAYVMRAENRAIIAFWPCEKRSGCASLSSQCLSQPPMHRAVHRFRRSACRRRRCVSSHTPGPPCDNCHGGYESRTAYKLIWLGFLSTCP
jgi:hypothetical protein